MLDNVQCPSMHTYATVEVNGLIIKNSNKQLYKIPQLEINILVITHNFQIITITIKSIYIQLGGNKCGSVHKTKNFLVRHPVYPRC